METTNTMQRLERKHKDIAHIISRFEPSLRDLLDLGELYSSLRLLLEKRIFSVDDADEFDVWVKTKVPAKDLVSKFLEKVKRADPAREPVENFAKSIQEKRPYLARSIDEMTLTMQYSSCSFGAWFCKVQVEVGLIEFSVECYKLYHSLKKDDKNPFVESGDSQGNDSYDEQSVAHHYYLRREKEALEGEFLGEFHKHMELETKCDFPQLKLMKDLSFKAWVMFESNNYRLAIALFENGRHQMAGLFGNLETFLFLIDLSNFYFCLPGEEYENNEKGVKCLKEASDQARTLKEAGLWDDYYEKVLLLNVMKEYLDLDPDRVFLGIFVLRNHYDFDQEKVKIAGELLKKVKKYILVEDKYLLTFCVNKALYYYQKGDTQLAVYWGYTRAEATIKSGLSVSKTVVRYVRSFGQKMLKQACGPRPRKRKHSE